jgi:uncharacterized protein YkwD
LNIRSHCISRPRSKEEPNLDQTLARKGLRDRASEFAVGIGGRVKKRRLPTLASINAFRAAHGRAALRSDPTMIGLARAHAEDMARRETLDHAGFRERRVPSGARAENVAYGCPDAPCAVRQWINSPGHRANMLLHDVTRLGLASAVSKSGRQYWTLELGK